MEPSLGRYALATVLACMAILVVMSLQGESGGSTAGIREDITTAAEYFTMVDQHFKTEKQLAALSNLPMAPEEEVPLSPAKAVANAAKETEAKAKAALLARKRAAAAKAASPTAAYEDLMDGQELALEMNPQKNDEDTAASDKAIAAGAVEDAFLEVKLKTKLAKTSGDKSEVIRAVSGDDEATSVEDVDVDVDDIMDDSEVDTDTQRMAKANQLVVMIPQTEAERMLEAASSAASGAPEELEDASDLLDVPEDDLIEEESTSSSSTEGRTFATEIQKKHPSPTVIAAPAESHLEKTKLAPHTKELSGPEKMLAGAIAAASKQVKSVAQENDGHAALETHKPTTERMALTTKHQNKQTDKSVNQSEDVRVIQVSKKALLELKDLDHANVEFHQAEKIKLAKKAAAQSRLEKIWAHAKVEAQLKANTPTVDEVAAAAAAGAVAGSLFVEPTEARMILTKKKAEKAKKAKKASPKKKAAVKPKKKVVMKPKSLSQMTGELLKTVDNGMDEEESTVPVPFHDDLLDKVQALHKAVADKASVLEAKDRRIAKKRKFQHDLMNGSDLHGNSKLERTIAFGKKVDRERREKRLAKARANAAKVKALSKVHKKVKLLNVPKATRQTADKGVDLLRSHLKGFWEKVHAVTAPKAKKVVKKKVVKKKALPLSPMMKNLMLNARAQHQRDMHHKHKRKVRKKLGAVEHHDDLEDIVANAVHEHQQEVDRRAHELLSAPKQKVHLFDQLVTAYGEDKENALQDNTPFVSSKKSTSMALNPDDFHDTVGADAVEAVTAKLQMKHLLGLDNNSDQDSQTATPLRRVFSTLKKSGHLDARKEDYFSANVQEIMSGKNRKTTGRVKDRNVKSEQNETPIWENDKFAQLMRVKLARERAQDMMHAALTQSSPVSNEDKTVTPVKLTRKERIAQKMKLMRQGLHVRL